MFGLVLFSKGSSKGRAAHKRKLKETQERVDEKVMERRKEEEPELFT